MAEGLGSELQWMNLKLLNQDWKIERLIERKIENQAGISAPLSSYLFDKLPLRLTEIPARFELGGLGFSAGKRDEISYIITIREFPMYVLLGSSLNF